MKKEILEGLLATPGTEHIVSEFDTHFAGDLARQEAGALLAEDIEKLSALQGKLYAWDRHSVLVIFQAMGAARKDGTTKHMTSGVNP